MNGKIGKHFWFFLIAFFIFSERTEGRVLHLKTLDISIPLLESYEIVPQRHWKNELKVSQQFIMSRPFEFDYLIQKYGGESSPKPFETSFFLIRGIRTRAITDQEFTLYIEKYESDRLGSDQTK